MEIVINRGVELDEINNEYLINFLDEKYSDMINFNYLKEEISKMKIKIKNVNLKRPCKLLLLMILLRVHTKFLIMNIILTIHM